MFRQFLRRRELRLELNLALLNSCARRLEQSILFCFVCFLFSYVLSVSFLILFTIRVPDFFLSVTSITPWISTKYEPHKPYLSLETWPELIEYVSNTLFLVVYFRNR
jgi:hypothetical protein